MRDKEKEFMMVRRVFEMRSLCALKKMESMLVAVLEARAALVEEGGVPVLVEIVEVGTQRQKEIAVVILLQVCKDFDGEEHRREDATDSDAGGHVEVVCDGGVLVVKFLL